MRAPDSLARKRVNWSTNSACCAGVSFFQFVASTRRDMVSKSKRSRAIASSSGRRTASDFLESRRIASTWSIVRWINARGLSASADVASANPAASAPHRAAKRTRLRLMSLGVLVEAIEILFLGFLRLLRSLGAIAHLVLTVLGEGAAHGRVPVESRLALLADRLERQRAPIHD